MEPNNDNRKTPRYRLEVRAQLVYQKDGFLQRVSVRTVDIAMNGIAVTSPLRLPEGESVDLDFMLPGNRTPFRVKAVIRNRQGFRYGIEFLSTTDAQKVEISRFGTECPSKEFAAGFSRPSLAM